jgi:hypothetical protein
MSVITLDDSDLERLAELVAERILAAVEVEASTPAGWLDTKAAAEYAGCSRDALHKATAARLVRFEQEREGGRCWFRAPWLDDWREGRSPS